jgi:hypothetical protein
MGGIYEASLCDGLRFHDIHTKFHNDRFRNLKVDKGEFTESQTHRQHGDIISLLVFF